MTLYLDIYNINNNIKIMLIMKYILVTKYYIFPDILIFYSMIFTFSA